VEGIFRGILRANRASALCEDDNVSRGFGGGALGHGSLQRRRLGRVVSEERAPREKELRLRDVGACFDVCQTDRFEAVWLVSTVEADLVEVHNQHPRHTLDPRRGAMRLLCRRLPAVTTGALGSIEVVSPTLELARSARVILPVGSEETQ
jgi:hypothetical protein